MEHPDNAGAPGAQGEGQAAAAGAADQGTAGQDGSLLSGGGAGEAAAAVDIPEKFQVKGQDGKLDPSATLQKVLGSYTHLEKRLGTGEAPPKSADDYKVDRFLPEGYEMAPEGQKALLGKMHSLGLNQKQVQGILNIYGETLVEALEKEANTMQQGMDSLKSHWRDQYDANLRAAKDALRIFGDEAEAEAFAGAIGNNPFVLRILAKVGREFSGDTPPSQMDAAEAESVQSLMQSQAYTDPKHADHAAVVRKVNAAFEKGFRPSGQA